MLKFYNFYLNKMYVERSILGVELNPVGVAADKD